jgi:hypothetical protein
MKDIPWYYIIVYGAMGTASFLRWYRKGDHDLHPCVNSNLFLVQAQCAIVVLDGIAGMLVLFGMFFFPLTILAHIGLCIYAVIITLRGIAAYRESEVGWMTPGFSSLMVVSPPLLAILIVRWIQSGG